MSNIFNGTEIVDIIYKIVNHFFYFFLPVSSDKPSTSIIIATPAKIHFLGGCLVFNCAVNTYVLPLSSGLVGWALIYCLVFYLPSGGSGKALQ
jgi:hypothetical protein